MDLSGKYYKAFTDRQSAIEKQYSTKQAEKQHSKGKLTAHERINLLFDKNTFEEIDAFVTPADQPVEFGKVERSYGDGVIVCLLYTSDAADDLLCVDLGGRRI